MFEGMIAGWKAAGETRRLVFKDKQLFAYPIIGAIAAMVEFVVMLLLFVLAGSASGGPALGTVVPLFVLFYIVAGFTSTYTIMAMFVAFRSFAGVGGRGKRISIAKAFSAVKPYSILILEWSIFYTVIIMIIRLLESRLRGISGALLGGVISLAVTVVTLFVVPIILDDKVGPLEAMKRSEQMIVKHFGSTFAGLAYSDLYGLAITVLGIVVFVAGVLLGLPVLSLLIMAAGGMLIVFGVLLSYILSNTFKLILYDYVKSGRLPQGFDKNIMKSVARYKNSGRAYPGSFA